MVKMATYRKQPMPTGCSTNPDQKKNQDALLARQIKAAYTLERRLWEERIGKTKRSNYTPHPKYEGKEVRATIEDRKQASKNVWLSVVQTLLPASIHPVVYVRVIVRALEGGSQAPPFPNNLVDEKWLKFFHRQSSEIAGNIDADLNRQCEYSKNALLRYQQVLGYDLKSAMYYLLSDGTAPLSALYRYCLAISMLRAPNVSLVDDVSLFQRVAKRLEESAVLQYTCFPGEYDSRWNDFIPAKFSQDARRIYSGMLSRCV